MSFVQPPGSGWLPFIRRKEKDGSLMIVCVYLNPTIDKTMYIDRLCAGGMNRVKKVTLHGAGKSMTFALVLKELGGVDVKVMGLMYKNDEAIITSRMDRAKIPYDFYKRDGNARVNVKVFDESTQQITEFNENGQFVDSEALLKIKERILGELNPGDYMVCSGSLPPGCPKNFYAELICAANQKGAACMLDAEGEALREGMSSKPYFIKPNRYELEIFSGKKIGTVDELLQICLDLIRGGIGLIAVSLGADGAMITDGKKAYLAPGMRVKIKSTVAAGDSMAAGILHSVICGEPIDVALKNGVAAATGTCMLEGTDLVTKTLFEELLAKVEISEIPMK